MRVPVDEAFVASIEAAVLSMPANEFKSDKRMVNDDGVPLWDIEVTQVDRTARFPRSEPMRVRVPSRTDPGISSLVPIRFGGLVVDVQTSKENKYLFRVYWRADTFTTELAPSARPSEPPAPKARVA